MTNRRVKLELIPPEPAPLPLGDVQITMPVESAIAVAAALTYLPLGRIDRAIGAGRSDLFDTFAALYEQLVSESGDPRRSEVYSTAKEAMRANVSVTRKRPDDTLPFGAIQ